MGRFTMPPIDKVLAHYGAIQACPRRSGWTPMKCYLHEDTRPSAQLSAETNRWHCHVCNIHEDSLDVIQREEGLNVAQARDRAEALFGIGGREVRTNPRQRGSLFGGSGGNEGSGETPQTRSLF